MRGVSSFGLLGLGIALLGAGLPPSAHAAFSGQGCLSRDPISIEECLSEFATSESKDSADWFAFLDKVKGQVYYNQELKDFRIHRNPPKEVPYKYQPSGASGGTPEEKLLLRESRRTLEVPYLSSGGLINLVTLRPFLDGHSDLIKQALRATYKFNYGAQVLAAAGSQDPDFYAWSDDYAHAQTPADVQGRVAEANIPSGGEAISEFVRRVAERIRAVSDLCQRGDIRGALYFLGFTLHAIQDLAAHNGRTAAEHSWNSRCPNPECDSARPSGGKEGDPDEDEENLRLARQYTDKFLRLAQPVAGDSCWEQMKYFEGPPLSLPEKLTTYKLDWQFTPSKLMEYQGAGKRFAQLEGRERYIIRWVRDPDRRGDEVFERIRQALRASRPVEERK